MFVVCNWFSRSNCMKIIVMNLTGKKIILNIEAKDTIASLKAKIHEKEEILLDQIALIFSSKLLEDDKTISDYNIQDGSIIHLLLRVLK